MKGGGMKTKSLILVAMVLLLSACSLKRPALWQINAAYYRPVPDKCEEVVREKVFHSCPVSKRNYLINKIAWNTLFHRKGG